MELREAIETRASVRAFRSDPVPAADLREIVRLAGRAPSPNNAQPWRFVAVTDLPTRREMARAVRRQLDLVLPEPENPEQRQAWEQVRWFSTFFETAPAVLAVETRAYESVVDRLVTPEERPALEARRGNPGLIGLGACIGSLLLAAHDLGYGACCLSAPLVAREALERIVRTENPWRLGALVALGLPAHPLGQAPRRDPDELLRFHVPSETGA